jgi:hypothetical protein
MGNQSKIFVVLLGGLIIMIFFTTASILPALAASEVQNQGASDFTPGHLKSSDEQSQSAKEFSPGIIQGRLPGGGCDAPLNSPGHLFKQSSTTTT